MATTESSMLIEVWSLIKLNVPQTKRLELAESLLKIYEEHGFDPSEMDGLYGNDSTLDTILAEVYDVEDEDADQEEED